MTFREKLADWISGGALSAAREEYEISKRSNRQCLMEHLHDSNKGLLDSMAKTRVENDRLTMALDNIRRYTAPQKSGTAQKVARMCMEALTHKE